MHEQSKRVVEGVGSAFGGFREFLMRGNVVELAVAVVIGAAFTSIVNAVVDGVINPLVGAFGTKDLEAYRSCLRGPCEFNEAGEVVSGIPIKWGAVLSASLTFLITAAVVYFLMIVPINRYKKRREEEPAPAGPTEVEILTEIRDALVSQRAPVEGVAAQRTASDNGAGASAAPASDNS